MGVWRWHLKEKLLLRRGVVSVVCGFCLMMVEGGESLRLFFILNVVDCTSPFCASDCEASSICECAYASCLPFQGALYALVELLWLVQVDDIDPSLCCRYYQELISCVHGVDSILTFYCGYWIRGTQIPVFDFLIPASCY